MKKCIINFSNGKFTKAQKRLKTSIIKSNFDGDILFWTNELPPNSPNQEESPWAFKVFAFLEAKKRGYDLALWLDSSAIVIKPLTKIFKIIKNRGYYLFSENFSKVGEWSSDIALNNFNITREKAFQINEVYAYCLGLNFRNKEALSLLNEWHKKAIDGTTFRGLGREYSYKDSLNNDKNIISEDSRVKGHRHDQTALSIISHKLNLESCRIGCYDYITKARRGGRYAKYFPINTIILINRDIHKDFFAKEINKYNNKKGLEKALFIFFSFLLTLKLYLKRKISKIFI
jgi:hypothetical protein